MSKAGRISGAMADAIEGAAAGKSEAVAQFVSHAQGYVGLLREHIEKEDHCLFTMANQALTEDDQQRLWQAFEHVEHEHMGLGTHEKFLQLADELADRFGVTRTVGKSSRACGCGHKRAIRCVSPESCLRPRRGASAGGRSIFP